MSVFQTMSERIQVSDLGVYAQRVRGPAGEPFWAVTGPQVRKNGDFDFGVEVAYGSVHDNGTIDNFAKGGIRKKHAFHIYLKTALNLLVLHKPQGVMMTNAPGYLSAPKRHAGGKARHASGGYAIGDPLTDADRDTCESCGSSNGWPHRVNFVSPSGKPLGTVDLSLCDNCRGREASWKAVKRLGDRRFGKLPAVLQDAIVADSVQFRRDAGYYRETPEQRKRDDACIMRVRAYDAATAGGKKRHAPAKPARRKPAKRRRPTAPRKPSNLGALVERINRLTR